MTEEQLKIIWKSVVAGLEPFLSAAQIKTWFQGSQISSLNPSLTEINVENSFAYNYISKFADTHLKTLLSKEAGFPIKKIEYRIRPQKSSKENGLHSEKSLFEQSVTSQNREVKEKNSRSTSTPVFDLQIENTLSSNLNPKYTFSNFIVGNRNRLAFAAAQAVADKPGVAYNPLYIYGGVGLGKTHLMQAIGNAVIAREPQKKVLYVSCENFVNEFITAIKSGKNENFKKKYRNIDVFLVDDIQFIAGKDGTQEEFFHTFNALYQTDKQIIITSDKVPSEIKNLEERLSSRFASGMIADIQPPDLETRQAILQAKCQEKKISYSNEILSFIAEEVPTNIRQLEGALTTVTAYLSSQSITQPTLHDIRQALKKVQDLHKPTKRNNAESLCAIICDFYQVEEVDLKGPRRQQELVKPRQILMYMMKHDIGMTFPAIGREIGGRDHTTVMHAFEKIEKELKRSEELSQELQEIKEKFYGQ